MSRAIQLFDTAVVLTLLIHVVDHQADGRAGGDTFEDAGEDSNLVGLVALGSVAGLTRAPAVQVALQIGFAEGHAGRAAVDHGTEGRPVALTEGGDPE